LGARGPTERERIRAALIDLVDEGGYEALELRSIAERTGLSSSAVAREFPNPEACFVAIWEEIDAELASLLNDAYENEEGDWPVRLRAALDAFLGFLDVDPGRARLYVVEVMLVSEAMRARREAAQARLAAIIGRGRQESEDDAPSKIAEAVSGAVWYRVESRLRRGDGPALRAELPLMTYFAVLPYRGTEIARAQLARRSHPE